MSEPHFVTRTAAGLAHGNTLALHRLWTVILYIDAPSQPPEGQDGQAQQNSPDGTTGQDSWRLVNDDGLYDRTLPRSEATRQDEKHLVVRFTEVEPEGTYSLYHCLPSEAEVPVFLAVPFAVLEDHGEETPEPSNENWMWPTLEPEPNPLSDDPLLLHDPVDHTLDPSWYFDYAWYRSDSLPEDPTTESGSQADDSAVASDPPQEDSAVA